MEAQTSIDGTLIKVKIEETTEVTDDIKTENDQFLMELEELIPTPNTQSNTHLNDDFNDLQFSLKEEAMMMASENISHTLTNSEGDESNIIETNNTPNILTDTTIDGDDTSIKEENRDGLVSYDYPSFDDAESMDSNDAAALGNVEACLQEEINIKCENEGNFEDLQKEKFITAPIKLELDSTLTETQIASNHIIPDSVSDTDRKYNFTTIPDDVVNEMDQIPTSSVNGDLYSHNTSYEDCDDLDPRTDPESFLTENSSCPVQTEDFQLNSITGNVTSLEQVYESMTRIFKCTKCTNTYTKKRNLDRHRKIHQTIDNYKNGIIKGKESRKKNLIAKIKMEMECYGMPDEDEADLKQDTSEGYECSCGKMYKRRSRMETCLRSHEFYENNSKCFSCVTCAKQFKTKNELALHRKRLHRKKFPCKFCPTDYETRKELFKHLQIHQKVQLLEYKVIEEIVNGNQKLECFTCSKTCAELSELKIHVMTDHKGPYSCPHCKNTFPKIIDFANHLKSYHPDVKGQSVVDVVEAFSRLVKEWKCEECHIQFYEADKLALHQIDQHSPEKSEAQFQCSDCRRVFITQKGLTSHKRIHHAIEGAQEVKPESLGIMCLECRKICKDMTALTSHMRFHSPDRKYPCKFCDFRFATPEKRKAHAEIHTGEMRYVCFICEYQCTTENRLKKHKMSLKHANIKEYLLTGKPLLEESSSSKDKRDNVKKRKKDKEGSESDSDSSLSDIDHKACDVCGEKFANEELMLEHKQTHPFIEFPNDDTPTRIFFK